MKRVVTIGERKHVYDEVSVIQTEAATRLFFTLQIVFS